ncbi:hypothetical protein MW887_009441 [Aspergillus wentii]|nr:hypothetical protein MW887_009441 [Aspergillus wentii]
MLTASATMKNGSLYIDGGIEVFTDKNSNGNPSSAPTLGYNTYLMEVDMKSSWNWQKNISINAINKTANPSTGTDPPLVVRGALYSGASTDSSIYLYGGTNSYLNTSFPGFQKPTSSQYALWSCDTDGDSWNQYDVTLNAPYRPAGGAYAEAPDQGLAFWLNGYIDNGTSNGLEGQSGLLRYLDGLIVIDTNKQTAKNVSTSSMDNFPRAKGGMAYISGVGSKGILVAIGGVTKPTSDGSSSNQGTYVSFNEIDFLDVASLDNGDENGSWYKQKASGDIPDGRIDFCLVTASAKDNSSHNIYMYGGQATNKVYDQIYVLSIPSFTWTRIYEGESPRYGHTCHLVANRQMLTVGGSSTDALTAACDWETKGVAVYDISSLTWGSTYDASASAYEVPSLVYDTVGGDANGNASMMTPSNGFSTTPIANFFQATNNSSSSSNTTSSTPSKKSEISGGAIAGAVVGSVAGAALIVALILFIINRRRKQAATSYQQAAENKGFDSSPTGATWRNWDGQMIELPSGQSKPPAQLPDSIIPHEMEANEAPSELHSRSRAEM